MKRVFISNNSKDDFGNDLLIKVICSYFPKMKFTILSDKGKGKSLERIRNLKIVDIKPNKAYKLYEKAIAKNDICICIGGSVLMEKTVGSYVNDYWDFLYALLDKPTYYINTDFGPYYSANFLSLSRDYLSDCSGVWFRDKFSYSKFNGKNIHYMPDISLATDFPEKYE